MATIKSTTNTSTCPLTAAEVDQLCDKVDRVERVLNVLKYLAIYIAGVSTANSEVAIAAIKAVLAGGI